MLNGAKPGARAASGGTLRAAGDCSTDDPGSSETKSLTTWLISTLKAAAAQDSANALRELKQMHARLIGQDCLVAISSLEQLWQKQLELGHADLKGAETVSRGGGGTDLAQLTARKQKLQAESRQLENEVSTRPEYSRVHYSRVHYSPLCEGRATLANWLGGTGGGGGAARAGGGGKAATPVL